VIWDCAGTIAERDNPGVRQRGGQKALVLEPTCTRFQVSPTVLALAIEAMDGDNATKEVSKSPLSLLGTELTRQQDRCLQREFEHQT
jgi:hypothetical protein